MFVLAGTAAAHAQSTQPASATPPPAAQPAPEPQSPRGVVATNNLDPEAPRPIEGWWTNGKELLEVAPDGAYRLFDTQNRYRKPIEVGRWSRQNHAVFWLEPYTMRKEARTRVPLSLVDDVTVITVRRWAPMRMIAEPPLVEEDLFIGLWAGTGGSLELEPSMRYRFVAPRVADARQPVVISSHRGAWRIKDGRVELLPDSPSVATVVLEPRMSDAPAENGATQDAKAERAPQQIAQLIGVEGVLDRVVERPTRGSDGRVIPIGPTQGQPDGRPAEKATDEAPPAPKPS
jgi:hypothetical protein